MNHVDDDCGSGAKRTMAFSKPLLPTAFVKDVSATALQVATRKAKIVQPIVMQDMPPECMAIVMQDPQGVQTVMSDGDTMQQIQTCMMGQQGAFQAKVLGDGACTEAEMEASSPPCENPTCIAVVKTEVSKLCDMCIPETDFPVVGVLFKCMMNHVDDDCGSGAKRTMAFSKPLLPTAFVKDVSATALQVATRKAKIVQ